ncbi:MAG: class II aldolase/adducin family protein [Pseudorhodoplanes sp.]|uniref:class II aldolase/adducin family protein n=1 Tax=Pseudorhodoplanes sp. TaxID=1934341 RepID=UPI003D0FFDED
MPGNPKPIDQQLNELARAHRILALNGHVNMTLGHMSWRDPEGRGFWLKRAGLGFEEVGKDDFILLDFDGNKLHGSGERHSEWPIHSEILRARKDVQVSVHSHPLHATIFSGCEATLQGVCHEAVMMADKVAYYNITKGLIRTVEQGRELAGVLGEKSAVLMKNHGMTTCGATIADATLSAIFLEKACNAEIIAAATGFSWSGPDAKDLLLGGAARLDVNPRLSADFWSYFCRRLDVYEKQNSISF